MYGGVSVGVYNSELEKKQNLHLKIQYLFKVSKYIFPAVQ